MPVADSRFVSAGLTSSKSLWTMPYVLISPHVAIRNAENIPECRYSIIEENVRRFLSGQELIDIVDKRRWY